MALLLLFSFSFFSSPFAGSPSSSVATLPFLMTSGSATTASTSGLFHLFFLRSDDVGDHQLEDPTGS